MKKNLLIALLLVPFYGICQATKPIDGFLGIKFGSSKEAVIAAVKAKGGILRVGKSTNELLEFTNVKLGHRTSTFFAVKLVNNKAFEADFFFDIKPEDKTIDEYYSLADDINGVYGRGESTRKFKEPYKDGDGYEITAIKQGDADYKILWQSGDNTVSELIDTDLSIELIYQNGPLVDQAIAKQKSKEKSDF